MAARTYTRAELRTLLEQIADIENDGHIGTTEKNEALNAGIAEAWDIIISAGLAEKYVKSTTFSAVAGTMEYNLFTIAADFYRIHQLYVVEGSNLRPLRRLNPAEIHPFTAPNTTGTLKLYYIPYAAKMTSDSDTFDGINGWEELVALCAAFRIKAKKDDSYNPFAQRKAEMIQRVKAMGNIDFGEPARVVQKRRHRKDPWLLFQTPINAYGVRGDKIELYYNSGYYQ